MNTPLGPHNVHEFLSAFADGELDAAQNLDVLDYLETHPDAFAYLRDRQRLRQSAQRVVLSNEHANTMPAELKARLNKVADTEGQSRGTGRRRWKWWPHLLGVMAASLALGAAVDYYGRRPRGDISRQPSWASLEGNLADESDSADSRDAALPAALVRAAMFVHLDCSRLDDRLHAGGYPDAVGGLSDLVKADLGASVDASVNGSVAAPDLRAAGFHFVGAGPCPRPLEATVHLLYRSDSEPRRTVSVFAQTYHGQFGLTPGRLYRVRGGPVLPLLAWRTQRVVYFLMADEYDAAQKVVHDIPCAPQRPGV